MDYEKEIPFGAFDSELMHQEINIPDGFEATIEGNKVILTKSESEDERIKNRIILCLEECVHNSIIRDYEKEKCLSWLEKQGKEKLTDKPKFKVGDWIVNNDDSSVGQITNIIEGEDGFAYEQTNGYFHGIFEKEYHLWTIQDAKDGDVLYSPCCKLLFIFKNDKECYVGNNLNYHAESIVLNSPICVPTDTIPATKEQRDILFQKMKEEGYEWDAEKKELKKIEQASAWSEEDEEQVSIITNIVKAHCGKLIDCRSNLSWLKSLKLRATWKPSDEQMNALWDKISNDNLPNSEKEISQQVALTELYEQLKKLREE